MSQIKKLTKSSLLNLVLDSLEKKKQALVFVNSKRSAEKVAEDIAKEIKKAKKKLPVELIELAEKIESALSKPTTQCKRIANCIRVGIAFHHAGLHRKQKELIEDNYRLGFIKIIACTPTLAFGLDLPAYRVIIRDLKRYTSRGLKFIPVLEYLQICGRAGRPKYDKVGEAIIVCDSNEFKSKLVEKYIEGEAENIYSKLAVEPVLRTYLLSLVSSGFVKSKKEILDFFNKTFWAFQYKDMKELGLKIERMILQLIDWEFIQKLSLESSPSSSSSSAQDENDQSPDGDFGDFKSANNLKSKNNFVDEKYRATFLGKRVAQLYLDPLTGHEFVSAIHKSANVQIRKDFSYLQLISNTLEMRPLLRVKNKELDEINEILAKYEIYLLQTEPSMYDLDYDDFLNSVKTAFMLHEWAEEKDDEFLLEKFSVRPGELRVKLHLADWLLYCIIELAEILQNREIIKEVKKTRIRLKYGVKEELLPLLKLKQIGRVRARTLFNNKLKTIKELKAVDLTSLGQLIGRAVAINVKRQLGEDIKEEISPKKRKGQMSLMKFDS